MLKRFFITLFLILAIWIAIQFWLAEPAPQMSANNNSHFVTIAHRGGRGLAPENTLMAFENSDKIGVDILEMDIHLTRDHQLIIIHDSTLNRTTNGKGKVNNFSLSEIQKFDAAYFFSRDPIYNNRRDSAIYQHLENENRLFPLRGKGVKIPKLLDVFRRFPQKRMIIEIKASDEKIVDPFCQMIKNFNKEDQLIVGSFSGKVLNRFRRDCPKVATSATALEATQFVLSDKIGLSGAITPGYIGLLVPPELKLTLFGHKPSISVASHSLMRAVHKKRLIVLIWTVNETEEMKKLIDVGVNGIMTDYPDRLLKLVGR